MLVLEWGSHTKLFKMSATVRKKGLKRLVPICFKLVKCSNESYFLICAVSSVWARVSWIRATTLVLPASPWLVRQKKMFWALSAYKHTHMLIILCIASQKCVQHAKFYTNGTSAFIIIFSLKSFWLPQMLLCWGAGTTELLCPCMASSKRLAFDLPTQDQTLKSTDLQWL